MDHDTQEKVFFLALTALLSGLLAPALVKLLDVFVTRQAERRRELRTRQLELLERLTKVVWRWRYNAKQVAYYGMSQEQSPRDREHYVAAVSAYETQVWEQFTEIKAIKSACLVWFADDIAEVVEALYLYLKESIDPELTTLTRTDPVRDLPARFQALSQRFTNEVSGTIESHVRKIAKAVL